MSVWASKLLLDKVRQVQVLNICPSYP